MGDSFTAANHRKLNKYEQMPGQHILKPIIFRVLSASHREPSCHMGVVLGMKWRGSLKKKCQDDEMSYSYERVFKHYVLHNIWFMYVYS